MRQTRLLALAASAAILASAAPVAAGPFDGILSIFGAEPAPYAAPPERSYYRYEGLEPVDGRRGRRAASRPAVVEDTKPVDTAIDPARVPDWYLADPTLRRGDIVVLARGVYVFQGGEGPRGPADFVPLERSRLSQGEKARVAAMTGYRPSERPTAALASGRTVAEASVSR